MQMAFPNRPGDVFVLQDLEQGIHQIQRLRLYRAEANILPGQTPLASQIDLHLKEQKPWWFQASLDNQGTKTTGENRSRVTLTLEDPLHMLDSLGLSVVHSERSDAALISYAIPRGYDTWSLTYAASQYSQPLPGDLLQKGGSKSATLGWNRVLHLSAEGKDSLDVSLSHSDSTREISGIDLMPERLTVMRNSYSHLRQGQGWRYWAEGNLVGGLSAIGARQDAAGLDRASPHAQFAKTEVHAGAIVDSGLAGLSYIGQFDAQFSDQGLYGPEQFHLGGMNSVRGYVETAISGDSGYVFRHELHGKSWLQESTSTQVTPLIFFDHGLVRAVHGAAQQIYSTGIGARATASHWGADLVLARPLLHISDATDNGWRIHAVFRIDL
jgi:hemolysin activation/secretion protein